MIKGGGLGFGGYNSWEARLLVGLLIGPVLAGVGWSQTCNDCHDKSQQLVNTAHEAVECSACHLEHEAYPHQADARSLTCDTRATRSSRTKP